MSYLCLTCKTEYYKTPGGKHRILSDINRDNIFLDPPPTVMEIKAKINNWSNFKSFCTTKKTIKKSKRQSKGWEKVFSNDAADMRLVSKIYN